MHIKLSLKMNTNNNVAYDVEYNFTDQTFIDYFVNVWKIIKKF